MKFYTLFISVLFVIFSCGSKEPVEAVLDFSKVRDLRIVNVFNESKKEDQEVRLRKPILPNRVAEEPYSYYSYLSLRPNKEFTLLIGNHFTSGEYVIVSNSKLELNSREYGTFEIEIIDATSDAIQVKGNFNNFPSDYMVKSSNNDHFYLNLINDFEPLNKENDIRSVMFNTWRIKPLQSETDEEIRKRLIDNLNYISAYMRVHMHGDFDGIHTAGIYSPFFFAKNGLHLLDWQKTSYYWKNIFFNDIEAEKAYIIIKKAFDNADIPQYSDDWLQYNESGIRNIITSIESKEE
jgi:hypothetical protein